MTNGTFTDGAAPGRFTIDARDPASRARASRLATRHGELAMPAFLPVATRGVVKTLTSDQVRAQGTPGLLANSFHLHLRPGEDAVEALGGLHRFMDWHGPIVTDSGGFQVFSLASLRKVTDEGVAFASPIDGSAHEFTPERVIQIQRKLGADVIMPLDECVAYPASPQALEAAHHRTIRWCRQSAAEWRAPVCPPGRREAEAPAVQGASQRGGPAPAGQLLFGIVQGGASRRLRLESATALAELGLPGYAVGGVSVGEGPALLREVLAYTLEAMPEDRPRYVMGVGTPEDLLDSVAMGADLFDCVMPTRNARGACAFTRRGKVRLRNAAYAASDEPIEAGCDCPCCRTVSRGYLRHLFLVGEVTAPALVSMHNVRFYVRLMGEAREAILAGRFEEYRSGFLGQYLGGGS